jgi:hypothetical protein
MIWDVLRVQTSHMQQQLKLTIYNEKYRSRQCSTSVNHGVVSFFDLIYLQQTCNRQTTSKGKMGSKDYTHNHGKYATQMCLWKLFYL